MSVFKDNEFIKANDILYDGVLHTVKKSRAAYQPIFEAFTNSLEAIKIRSKIEPEIVGSIDLIIRSRKDISGTNEFVSLTISDNGVGFNDEEFKRFNTFKDYTKGFKNLGSGRIQYAHYFEETVIISIFQQGEKFYERNFSVSKRADFLRHNAIVFHKYCKETDSKKVGSRITFNSLYDASGKYNELDETTLKEALLERYVHYFCYNKSSLPAISITHDVHNEEAKSASITIADIPSIDKTVTFALPYWVTSETHPKPTAIEKKENFTLDAFRIKNSLLEKNQLNLVSKGEVIEESPIKLQNLGGSDKIGGSYFLFLISSNYVDSKDSNLRGDLELKTRAEVLRDNSLWGHEEIFVEDIQNKVDENIVQMYPEIEKVQEEHEKNIEELKEMFLLGDENIKDLGINLNDTEAKILEKYYEAEAKKLASIDAKIKKSFDSLVNLDPTTDKYQGTLEREVIEIVKAIPNQNKTTLSHYVARRKIVLELFQKILDRQLTIQNPDERNMDESLIHNLLFQQGSNEPDKSDLWILDEEFIYFKGVSESNLSTAKIDNKPLFKESFSVEEERYLKSLGENRKIKRPDILLFPSEGKCIIIELKSPEVNVSEHLTQIDMYASLILNHGSDDFKIDTFYGYLIGQSIEPRDVLGRVSTFEHSLHFDYLFRPSTKVNGFGKPNGSIYTEVIKYTTLVERAKLRNKVFIEKLMDC